MMSDAGRSWMQQWHSAPECALDPDEVYRCGHCNAEVHPDDKWCRTCDGILTDKHKIVEMTYTRGQIIGYVVVAVIVAVIGFAMLHYVFASV